MFNKLFFSWEKEVKGLNHFVRFFRIKIINSWFNVSVNGMFYTHKSRNILKAIFDENQQCYLE